MTCPGHCPWDRILPHFPAALCLQRATPHAPSVYFYFSCGNAWRHETVGSDHQEWVFWCPRRAEAQNYARCPRRAKLHAPHCLFTCDGVFRPRSPGLICLIRRRFSVPRGLRCTPPFSLACLRQRLAARRRCGLGSPSRVGVLAPLEAYAARSPLSAFRFTCDTCITWRFQASIRL